MPADIPNAQLPYAQLASVLFTRGSFFIQEAGRIHGSGTSRPSHHEHIRRDLAEIENALLAYERAEFEAHRAKQEPLSVVKSEGVS